ncbi:MAG: hypothetical protein EA370_00840 [Wenzhouxiangella sp.]|nr:MAG: hypothetical protein EA370_00840 [Wenzhouxiangella sp.]
MSDDQNTPKDNQARADEPSRKEKTSAVKEMFVLALLYLPLGFFLWFFAAALLMLPTRLIVEALLTGLFPGLFASVFQDGFIFELQSPLQVRNPEDGRMMPLTWVINPMIYAWGMALLFGLIMATPLKVSRRLIQLAIGFAAITVVAVWGTFWEAWRDLAFLFGPDIGAAVREQGISPNVIALCYQLGYLMFPAVVPVATWILMNRDFIESEVLRHRS